MYNATVCSLCTAPVNRNSQIPGESIEMEKYPLLSTSSIFSGRDEAGLIRKRFAFLSVEPSAPDTFPVTVVCAQLVKAIKKDSKKNVDLVTMLISMRLCSM